MTGLVVFVGPWAIMWYGLKEYPPLEHNPRLLLAVPLVVLVVAWIFSIAFRRRLMPWGERAPYVMWAGTLVIAVLPAMATAGALLIANGVFDHSARIELRTRIIQTCGRDHEVLLASPWRTPAHMELILTTDECLTADVGDSVRLALRSGAFGLPWVAAHSFHMDLGAPQ